MHYNLCPLVKLAPKSMGQVVLIRFESQEKIRPIGGRIKNHSDQSEHVLRILNYIAYFKRMK